MRTVGTQAVLWRTTGQPPCSKRRTSFEPLGLHHYTPLLASLFPVRRQPCHHLRLPHHSHHALHHHPHPHRPFRYPLLHHPPHHHQNRRHLRHPHHRHPIHHLHGRPRPHQGMCRLQRRLQLLRARGQSRPTVGLVNMNLLAHALLLVASQTVICSANHLR